VYDIIHLRVNIFMTPCRF